MTLRILMLLLPALALILGACALLQPVHGPSPVSSNVAVVSLFNTARQDRRAGNFSAADATLGRACVSARTIRGCGRCSHTYASPKADTTG